LCHCDCCIRCSHPHICTGYGHIAPVTRVGRIATIIYACIGIPLLLMVLADLGRLFTRSVKYVLKSIRSVIYAKRLRGIRRAGRRATQAQQVSVCVCRSCLRKHR
jgi:hypothetical protein